VSTATPAGWLRPLNGSDVWDAGVDGRDA